jgi:hypothetical protein
MTVTKEMLLRSMLEASPGDRSILEVLVQKLPSSGEHEVMTVAGSANFRLWSQMVEYGWMTRKPDPAIPQAPTVPGARFALTAKGRDELTEFLNEFKRFQAEHAKYMSDIFNTLCMKFVADVHERVVKAGGTTTDIATLTALTLKLLVKAVYRPESRVNGFDEIANLTRRQLSSESAAGLQSGPQQKS